ncbi:arylsulfatase [Apiospora saccharicola]|uniref:Arylsulfatase n=1 Tax=Apiospora saccharicola TaxID=335842 RepID=A0ABR1WHY7_9PEZI
MDILQTILDLAGVQLRSSPERLQSSECSGHGGLGAAGRHGGPPVGLEGAAIQPPKGPGSWELDELSTDLGEVHDLAASRPGGLRVILHHYETETSDGGVKKRKAEELVNGGPKQ